MSMSKCKCDKIFDTDEELNSDEKGECCCDNCYEEMSNVMDIDIKEAMIASIETELECVLSNINFDNVTEILMEKGYRKVKL